MFLLEAECCGHSVKCSFYAILLHLGSKEFQKIQFPCMPLYRETAKFIFTYIYSWKVVALQKNKPLYQKQVQPWWGWGSGTKHCCFIHKLKQKSIVGINWFLYGYIFTNWSCATYVDVSVLAILQVDLKVVTSHIWHIS